MATISLLTSIDWRWLHRHKALVGDFAFDAAVTICLPTVNCSSNALPVCRQAAVDGNVISLDDSRLALPRLWFLL